MNLRQLVSELKMSGVYIGLSGDELRQLEKQMKQEEHVTRSKAFRRNRKVHRKRMREGK